MMEAKFSKGDKVIIKSLGNKIGIIDGEPKETKGKIFSLFLLIQANKVLTTLKILLKSLPHQNQ